MSLLVAALTVFGASAVAGGGLYFRHSRRGLRCESLWREKRIAESLNLALECRRYDFVKTSLARLPVTHRALSDGMRAASAALISLLEMVSDPRNTYLPDTLRRQTRSDCHSVLHQVFKFAERLHLIESQGHLPPEEEAARVAASFAVTRQQAVETEAALARLTFSGSASEMKAARNKVKALAWQANETYDVERLSE